MTCKPLAVMREEERVRGKREGGGEQQQMEFDLSIVGLF